MSYLMIKILKKDYPMKITFSWKCISIIKNSQKYNKVYKKKKNKIKIKKMISIVKNK